MKADELIKEYIKFFKKKKHKEIPNASLIPEHDPTVLFTTAGMHPIVPFLMGQKHPEGNRLVNVQKCIRTQDIDEVGDDFHLTFFEMLGNWSLGNYWKKDAIKYSYEFLTKVLKLDKDRLAVSCFKGDENAEKDEEASNIWLEIGIPKERIVFLGKKDNWWGPAGETGPCGPDSEMFFYVGEKVPEKFDVNDKEWVEIWNDVFMQYNKTKDGKYESAKQKNVDTGMGVERTIMVLNGHENVYETELFKPLIDKIKKLEKKVNIKSERIIADHLKAACFILNEKISPSNVEQGYVLRRLIRRAIRHGKVLGINHRFCKEIIEKVIKIYDGRYKFDEKFIFEELKKEEGRFDKSLNTGMRIFEREVKDKVSGKIAFKLFSSYGFPIEMIKEVAKERNLEVDEKGFEEEFKKHQELSRTATKGKFKSGLADNTEETTKLHTATHLLLAALRKILKKDIHQKGSNINPERLRFDFNFDRKLTEKELEKIEDLVNEKINEQIEVKCEEMDLSKAKKKGIKGMFQYGRKVKVYFINKFSVEICAGPHVKNTKELGKFKIIKQESVGAGVRRIKAILE